MTDTLRRGQTVLLDSDLRVAGRPLRGRRGTVHRLGPTGVQVCTCSGHGGMHAHTCPIDVPLHRDEVLRATTGSPT